jgi:hypothetical protein
VLTRTLFGARVVDTSQATAPSHSATVEG